MQTLVFLLFIFSLGLMFEIVILTRRLPLLRVREQTFRFHGLRDELQELAIRGEIRATSATFQRLMCLLNVGIRNARVMKVRDLLSMLQEVREVADPNVFQQDLQDQSARVQQLAGECFTAFASMLVANEWVLSLVISAAKISAWRFVAQLLKPFAPTHVQAVRQAKWYSETAKRFSHSSALSHC